MLKYMYKDMAIVFQFVVAVAVANDAFAIATTTANAVVVMAVLSVRISTGRFHMIFVY